MRLPEMRSPHSKLLMMVLCLDKNEVHPSQKNAAFTSLRFIGLSLFERRLVSPAIITSVRCLNGPPPANRFE
jgi:hypothetical protein